MFSDYFSRQARKPSGWFGRLVMAIVFNRGNAAMNAFMLEMVSVKPGDHILEIGFGTGKLMQAMANQVQAGIIEGVDFSETMVAMAKKRNHHHMAAGRVIIHQGDFDTLGMAVNRFDKVCTVNTVYFWPDPNKTLQKIRRLLKPGGKLLLGFHTKSQLEQMSLDTDVFRFYSREDIRNLLQKAGFDGDVEMVSNQVRKSYVTVAIAVKE